MFTLTKNKALEILGDQHEQQRDLNWQKVYHYRNEFNNGKKIEKPLEFTDGKLSNGQHRLMGFVLSTQTFMKIETEKRFSK